MVSRMASIRAHFVARWPCDGRTCRAADGHCCAQAVAPLAGRPLPAHLAHWLHDVGVAAALLCAVDGARIGAFWPAVTSGHAQEVAQRWALHASLLARQRASLCRTLCGGGRRRGRRPVMLRRCRDG
ncbi:pentatricopeptide repeat-containing protein [Dorcoceras hygrometricum]|uniref:Pentatricopeptide repeat-containing protein n=1 Tax=Dorcoceras hygrometricum TaxID=472368 RepID=A0A2Z6ZRV1_9LAMI|nr:pentatricopeptide repeat-containing protein [Dorcoceras hygrometricum]